MLVTIQFWTFRSSRLLSKNIKIRICQTIILSVVLYRCETWSLTLREERGLRTVENRVLSRTFRPKRDEVTRRWRKLHNKELRDLCSSPNTIRTIKSSWMKWAGNVARIWKKSNAYRLLVVKLEGRNNYEDQHVGGWIILRWISGR
jgi:hypothetical protein